ncbi:MAG: glycosyltransferase family 39 protein [Candidatus Thermoplasmatota archaeon]|nr:glycosyltransferase family 39 protein [Candidatus Thermoplasmatota archaeon]
MRQQFISKLRALANNWAFWLILITGAAIFIRLLPALLNAAWGCDFGIYYGLTNSFVENKALFNQYDGWGSTYQYFPVLYAITGIAHWATGIEVLSILPKLAPIFGGLTIAILYFIVFELMKNRRIALLSAMLLAIATFHVYQTSHAAPLTVGHFFMLLSMYFFIRYIKKKEFIVPLLASTFLLILSHHFTTYFYIISITFILFASIASKQTTKKTNLHILTYVSIASALAFGYWAFVAKPVFYSFMQGNMFLPSYQIILLYYVFLYGGSLAFLTKKKYAEKLFSFPQFEMISRKTKIAVFFITLLALSSYATIMGIPGVYIKITPLALLYSLPMLLLVSLSLAGFSDLKKTNGGIFIRGWSIALLLSFLYSLVSSNFFPDRHLEYLIVPLCIPAAIVVKEMLEGRKEQDIKKASLRLVQPVLKHPHINVMAVIVVGIMCISNIMVAYPTIDALNSIDERVSQPCINTFEWMEGNISNVSVVASDHRLSMILWAEDFNITYGETNRTWTAENATVCFSELKELNVTHIVIDDIMRETVININVGKYYHMSNESYEKFASEPFELIYRNATVNDIGEELHWVEVYKVNKSYFDIYNQ